MKAKELMIGDWIMINPISYYQVEQIRMEFGELRIYPKDTEVFVTENEIMPIPLTPEILEKNGFEKWDDGWCTYDQENTGIEVAWVGTILKIGGECGNLELPAVMYIHELQHALRLCKIEKEIVL